MFLPGVLFVALSIQGITAVHLTTTQHVSVHLSQKELGIPREHEKETAKLPSYEKEILLTSTFERNQRVKGYGDSKHLNDGSIRDTEDNRVTEAGIGGETVHRAIFTFCCLFLVYTSVGIGGSVYIEWKVVSTSTTHTGSEVTSRQRRILRFGPLLMGVITYLVAVYLYMSGDVSDSITSWVGLTSGILISFGAGILLIQDLVTQYSHGNAQESGRFLSFDDDINLDTLPVNNNDINMNPVGLEIQDIHRSLRGG